MKSELLDTQLSLFFKDTFSGEPENISLDLKKLFLGIDVQILPFKTTESDIPLILGNSTDFNLNFSRSRIDIHSKKENFIKENIDKIFEILIKSNITISRIGIVYSYFRPTELEEFKKTLNHQIFKTEEITEINIRVNRVNLINGVTINNSENYLSAVAVKEDVKTQGILINRDINSRIEDINVFDLEKTKLFILEAEKLLKDFIFK